MKNILFLAGLTICSLLLQAQTSTLQEYIGKAREAYQGGDHARFYELIMEAHKLHPYHQGVLYQAGLAAALNNKPAEAISYLTEAIQIKADYDLTHQALASLAGRDDFTRLKALQSELQQPVIHSDTAFLVKDRTLHIESIAAGEAKNIFYAGSIHKRKIVRIDEKGNFRDFTKPAQDGLTAVFGIKIDAGKKILWACASPIPQMENFDSAARPAVFKYDIGNGKFLARYSPVEKKDYVLGDLALSPDGSVFTSDSRYGVIFTVNESTGKLESYFTSPEFWSVQGLSFSDDGRYLFIADYVRGIFRLDTKDRTLTLLAADFPLSLKSIDGLTFYNNSLIAIQNMVYPMRVTQYFLNAAQDRLINHSIIDRAHPAFNEPTIGCRVNNTFYYVANSLWAGYNKDNRLKPEHELQDVVILKAELK